MSYNEKHYPNLGHLKDALFRQHGEVSELAALVVGTIEDMILQADIVIPTSAWTVNTDSTTKADGYDYIADVSVPNLIENANVNVTLSIHSLSIAGNARMSKTVLVSTGGIRFFSQTKPTADLAGKLDAIQLDDSE